MTKGGFVSELVWPTFVYTYTHVLVCCDTFLQNWNADIHSFNPC